MIIWHNAALESALGIQTEATISATRLVIDSRQAQEGDLFLAIKGDHHDGHAYINQAFKQGCVAAIASQPGSYDGPVLVVEDTLKALEALARFARTRFNGRVIGITGSMGKTTTKEMLQLALQTYGTCYATHGNLNNHIGVPLTLANLPVKGDYAVIEMGMNSPDEIRPLSHLSQPDIALVSNVAPVHLAGFKNIAGIANAKAEIFAGLRNRGQAIIGMDHAFHAYLAAHTGTAALQRCGQHPLADVQIIDSTMHKDGLHLTLNSRGQHYATVIATYNAAIGSNASLVLGCLQALELDPATGLTALRQWQPLAGRGLMHHHNGITLIDDSYNANPAAMTTALEAVAQMPGRKIAVLGDMLELGPHGQDYHHALAPVLGDNGFAAVFTCGAMMAAMGVKLPQSIAHTAQNSSADLIAPVLATLQLGDVVLIKGSAGMHLHNFAEKLIAQINHT